MTEPSKRNLLYPLESNQKAHEFSLDWAWYDRAQTSNERPGISFMIRAKNESKNIERCIESVRSRLSSAIRCEFVVCDNGSTDDTCAIAERLFAKSNDGKVIHYPFQLGKAGAEMHLTPLNSVHSIAWSCQYLMMQTTPLSTLAIWDADFEMTDGLAERLISDAQSERRLASAYSVPAIDYDNVINEEIFFFSAANLPRFHKFWMWKLITYSTVPCKSAVKLNEKEYIVHNSTLKNVKSFQKYQPWWKKLTDETDNESWHRQLNDTFERMKERLAPDVQLFCRYCDPACQRICNQFPHVREHFPDPNQIKEMHKRLISNQNQQYKRLWDEITTLDFDSILLTSNWAQKRDNADQKMRFCEFANTVLALKRPTFPLICGENKRGFLFDPCTSFGNWLGQNIGIRRFDIVIFAEIDVLVKDKSEIAFARLEQKITETMYSAVQQNGVLYIPYAAINANNRCETGWPFTHPLWKVEKIESTVWLSIRWRQPIDCELTVLFPAVSGQNKSENWSVLPVMRSLHNLALTVSRSTGTLSERLPLLLHFDHRNTPTCRHFLSHLTFLLSKTTKSGEAAKHCPLIWQKTFSQIKKVFFVDIIVSRRRDDLGFANAHVRLLNNCKTPFYFMWQSDCQCAPCIDFAHMFECMKTTTSANHLHLKHTNTSIAKSQLKNALIFPEHGLSFMQTNCWSANPHFGRKGHWKTYVSKLYFQDSIDRQQRSVAQVLTSEFERQANSEMNESGACQSTVERWGLYECQRTDSSNNLISIKKAALQVQEKPIVFVFGDNFLPDKIAKDFGFETQCDFLGKKLEKVAENVLKIMSLHESRPIWIIIYCREHNSFVEKEGALNFLHLVLQHKKSGVQAQIWTCQSDCLQQEDNHLFIEKISSNIALVEFHTQCEWHNKDNWAAQKCSNDLFVGPFRLLLLSTNNF